MSYFTTNVANVNQAKIADLVDLANLFNEENEALNQKGEVKTPSHTYTVTIVNNQVSVKSNGFFFGLFDRTNTNRLRQSLQEQYNRLRNDCQQAREGGGVRQTMEKSLAAMQGVIAGGPRNANREIVQYGMSRNRLEALSVYQQFEQSGDVHMNYIDNYNKYCGISGDFQLLPDNDSPNVPTYNTIINDIKNGQLKFKGNDMTNRTYDDRANYPDEKLTAWANFLRQNLDKVDLFAKIKSNIAEGTKKGGKTTGWAGMIRKMGAQKAMEAFVKKNLPGGEDVHEFVQDKKDIQYLAKILISVSKKNNPTVEDIEASIRECVPAKRLATYGNAYKQGLNAIIRNAFFRQTSKLGLEFFHQQGVPIMFQWCTHGKLSLDKAKNTIMNTWWKDKNSKVENQYGAPITFSEMRKVLRMEKDPTIQGLQIHKVGAYDITSDNNVGA